MTEFAAAAPLVAIFHVCCSGSSVLVGILLPLALNSTDTFSEFWHLGMEASVLVTSLLSVCDWVTSLKSQKNASVSPVCVVHAHCLVDELNNVGWLS